MSGPRGMGMGRPEGLREAEPPVTLAEAVPPAILMEAALPVILAGAVLPATLAGAGQGDVSTVPERSAISAAGKEPEVPWPVMVPGHPVIWGRRYKTRKVRMHPADLRTGRKQSPVRQPGGWNGDCWY